MLTFFNKTNFLMVVLAAVTLSSCSKKTAVTSSFKERMYSNQEFLVSTNSFSNQEANNNDQSISDAQKELVLFNENSPNIGELSNQVKGNSVNSNKEAKNNQTISTSELVTNPSQIKAKGISSILLKKAEKKIQKQVQKNNYGKSGTDQLVALLLAIFVGCLGIHRFYLGYIGIGILQLLTFGGCGIWALIDLIRIATGDLKPNGAEYEKTI